MSLSEKAGTALEALGLTKTQVKAYVALIEKGTMTASEVSRAARIPYSKVYEALEGLHANGWIEEQKSRPILYTAKSPDTAIEEMNSRTRPRGGRRSSSSSRSSPGSTRRRASRRGPRSGSSGGQRRSSRGSGAMVLDCRNELLIALPLGHRPVRRGDSGDPGGAEGEGREDRDADLEGHPRRDPRGPRHGGRGEDEGRCSTEGG